MYMILQQRRPDSIEIYSREWTAAPQFISIGRTRRAEDVAALLGIFISSLPLRYRRHLNRQAAIIIKYRN
ncbi:hypothetical protein AOLI_G00047550 [Acnodon oligacanthus]